jgi:hypothetical protein
MIHLHNESSTNAQQKDCRKFLKAKECGYRKNMTAIEEKIEIGIIPETLAATHCATSNDSA